MALFPAAMFLADSGLPASCELCSTPHAVPSENVEGIGYWILAGDQFLFWKALCAGFALLVRSVFQL